jgi:hypothetical protein
LEDPVRLVGKLLPGMGNFVVTATCRFRIHFSNDLTAYSLVESFEVIGI